jgi:hypothetical protein
MGQGSWVEGEALVVAAQHPLAYLAVQGVGPR